MGYPVAFADRVLETTNTVGTGAMTLAGALNASQRAFSVLPDQSFVKYCITDNSTFFENGQGTFSSGANTLSRDIVDNSSNSGALVNLPAGSKQVFIGISADLVANIGKLNAQNVFNAKAYGAKGDLQTVSDGTITSGTANLSSTMAVWKSTDVGKYISVAGAGASGAMLTTTILTFTDATHVVLTLVSRS